MISDRGMVGHGAVVDLGWALADVDHVGNISKETGCRLLRESFLALLTQGLDVEQAQRRLSYHT